MVPKERLAYLQWALKPGDTQLFNKIAGDKHHEINALFDGFDTTLKERWEHWEAGPPMPPQDKVSAPPPASSGAAPSGAAIPAPVVQSRPAPEQTPPPQTPPAQTAPPSSGAGAAQPPMPFPAPTMPSSPPLRFHIKNARQGEPFDTAITIQPEGVKPLLCRIGFPEDMGLAADLPNWRVHGTPERSGEFQLVVEYRDDGASPVRSGVLPFIVNSDPETLWKDKPSDRNAPFWKADNAYDCVQGSDARIVAARRRGRSHAHNGTCCDDDYVVYADPPNGWQLAIVADGAGSAKFSRRGSQVATAAAAEFLRQQVFASQAGEDLRAAILGYVRAGKPDLASAERKALGKGLVHDVAWLLEEPASVEGKALGKCLYTTIGYAAHAAFKALHKEARERADVIASVKDLSTTLLIGLACKVDSRWFCAAYWVGDGAVAVYRKNAEVILLGASDSGEFSGQTRFLAAEEVRQDSLLRRLRFAVVEDMTAFILMTDGVSDAKFSSEAQLGKLAAWDALWADLGEARLEENGDVDLRLLDWLDFRVSGEYDDRTIAIIY